jgi:hypothetical protein
MSRDWEETFRRWKEPSSENEGQKCQNAERMIRDAIQEDDALSKHKIEIFAQGSYHNNTNVRLQSDVDICVRLMDVFFTEFSFANGLTKDAVGLVDATYTYPQFKNDVERALINKFGEDSINRGNKAFDVHANSYRVDADVVACCEHRRYSNHIVNGEYFFVSGTELHPDNGGRIINWPHQHYNNGVEKNNATGHRFKHIVRCLKRLKNEMADTGVPAATPIPSYLIECLVWNAPNGSFGHQEYVTDVESVLKYTSESTATSANCSEWGEVNELKYLFKGSQPWTLEQAHTFLDSARNYIESK